MSSPFPGMNPYLENPEIWREFHHWLITEMADNLNQQLLPKYRAAIEKRVYEITIDRALLVGIPDVTVRQIPSSQNTGTVVVARQSKPLKVDVPMPEEIRESYLEIRDIPRGKVVTVVELLSPTNKSFGIGREKYLQKREKILASKTHLLEIDLLRNGEPMPVLGQIPASDYRILISRSDYRPTADLFLFNIEDNFPLFTLPMPPGEIEPAINLQILLAQVYQKAGYDYVIDYSQEPN